MRIVWLLTLIACVVCKALFCWTLLYYFLHFLAHHRTDFCGRVLDSPDPAGVLQIQGPQLLTAADLGWPLRPGRSVPEIIAHDQAKNEPTRADRALQRTADLRFSDTSVVAHRDFHHAESGQGAFEDHLNRPAIGGLFECERA